MKQRNIIWVHSKMRLAIEAQIDGNSCGPAVMKEVIKRKFHREERQEDLKYLMGTDDNGTSQKKMLETAFNKGFEAFMTTELDLNQLQTHLNQGHQVILNWMSGHDEENDGHYSVLDQVSRHFITISDPDGNVGSLRTFERKDFEKFWYDWEGESKVEHWALVMW